MPRILLDLNEHSFQEDLFKLGREEATSLLGTLRRLHDMDWNDLYRDRGLRWESIQSRRGPAGNRLYSLRISKRIRAVAFREGDYLRFVSLHPDHDSAYS